MQAVHLVVEDDEVGLHLGHASQRLEPVDGGEDAAAQRREQPLQQREEVRGVVDDEDPELALAHGDFLPLRGRGRATS